MNKPRYVVQWDAQPVHFCKTMCSLLESQILVDMTVMCNSYSIKVHKCVMAANSSFFRDHLQKDILIDKVVINGIKHSVMKAIIEFIYCGETSVYEDNINELIAAANFFKIRGLKSILPHKLGIAYDEKQDFLLPMKPPIFFCKNEKIRPTRKDSFSSDIVYSDKDVKIVLEDNNFTVFENSKRNRRPQTSTAVTAEAHVALAKEEAASRFALEMLQKDLSNTTNLFVIEESCTEATVETSLTTQYENTISSHVIENSNEIHHNDVQNLSTRTPKSFKSSALANENINGHNDKLVKDAKSIDIEESHTKENNKCSEKIKECLQILQNDLPSDLPILYKASDGSYMNVTSEVLKSLAEGGSIQYQVVHEDGHVGVLQHYICNDFTDLNVEDNPSHREPDKSCHSTLPKTGENKHLTLTQLVDDTVSSDFTSVNDETHFPQNVNSELINISASVPMISSNQPLVENSPQNHEGVTDMPFNDFMLNSKESLNFLPDSSSTVPKLIDEISSYSEENSIVPDHLVSNDNIDKDIAHVTPLKRKRGRPRKVKSEDERLFSPANVIIHENNKIVKDRVPAKCNKNLKQDFIDDVSENIEINEPNQLKEQIKFMTDVGEKKFHRNRKAICDDAVLIETQDVNGVEKRNEIIEGNCSNKYSFEKGGGGDCKVTKIVPHHDEKPEKKSIYDLITLNKDIPFAVGLLPLSKIEKKSPESKRRCTRSSNKFDTSFSINGIENPMEL